jgi:hypothetical protein
MNINEWNRNIGSWDMNIGDRVEYTTSCGGAGYGRIVEIFTSSLERIGPSLHKEGEQWAVIATEDFREPQTERPLWSLRVVDDDFYPAWWGRGQTHISEEDT